ncbi:MAG: hypothetical protein HY770_06455, partial [Chitinivibrionia bacterium]|nr:hypothetical protein [Chitinivibrionia bacterium]
MRLRRVSLMVAVLWCMPALSLADDIRLVSETNGEMVVEVRFDNPAAAEDPPMQPYLAVPGLPRLHYARFFVAVPRPDGWRVTVAGGDFAESAGGLPERVEAERGGAVRSDSAARSGWYPHEPIVVSRPVYFRNVPMIGVDCYAVQVDYDRDARRTWSAYTIRIQYPPIEPGRLDRAIDPFVAGLVMNRRFIPAPAPAAAAGADAQAAPDPHFSLSSNWIRIEIESRGMYAVTGSDIFSLGFSLDAIDPSTMRLFSAGGINQSRSFADTTGTWKPGAWMTECAVLVRDGSDGAFNPQDSLVFYAVGPQGWKDHYKPGAPDSVYFDHLYSTSNVYFLTWGGSFGGAPKRMDPSPAQPAGGPYRTTFPERAFFEKNIVKNFDFGGDGWLWTEENAGKLALPPGTKLFPSFQVKDLVEQVPQSFRTVALAPYCGLACPDTENHPNDNHHAVYKMNGAWITEKIWNTGYAARYENGTAVSASGYFLQEGLNRLTVEIPRDLNPIDFMYFDFYSIAYERSLRADGGALAFSMPDTAGLVNMQVDNFPASGSLSLFDVTGQFDPLVLNGFATVPRPDNTRTARFSRSFSGEKKHFWACAQGTFKRPPSMRRHIPRDLRNTATSPDMVILYHGDFRAAAERLRAHRMTLLPYCPNPDVASVDIQDAYDNFSGGVHDPMAVRNYCKFLYDRGDGGGSPRLRYLALLGDANSDYKNFAASQPDYLPTDLILNPFEGTREAYATDDRLVLMDAEDEISGYSIPDIAVGRLPAGSVDEADGIVDKIIGYETSNEFGAWRNRILLVADDEKSTNTNADSDFILQSESLADGFVPPYIDVFKIYLTEFPDRGGENKEDARNLFISQWRKGALLINYIGHGSTRQMADEKVFLEENANELDNGYRLPLMCAFSCTIGDFDNAAAKSLSEKLLLKKDGGVIGCISASQVTYIFTNYALDFNLFRALFPSDPGFSEPAGLALIEAKLNTLPFPNRFQMENNDKYNLMGDPAVRLAIPRTSVAFHPEDVDRMLTGTTKSIRGTVQNDSGVDSTFSGTVLLFVRESDDTTGYTRAEDGFYIPYRYPGGYIYRGTAGVASGRFVFNFHVPQYPNPGSRGYVMAYAHDDLKDVDAAAAKKDMRVVYPAPGTPPPEPLDGAPRIRIGFEGGMNKIKPGAVLRADVEDADGINILSTTNEGSQVLVLDQSGIPIGVSDYFTFHEGGSDTSGYLRYAMNDISPGNHRVIYKVGDSFGQLALDTLYFTVVHPMDNFAEAVLNYPNPFSA